MPDPSGQQQRLEALEGDLRILSLENQELTERAEDTLLLSLLAEKIGQAATVAEVIARGLEHVSMLKDVPLSAYCLVNDSGVIIETAFISSGEMDLSGAEVQLPSHDLKSLPRETVYLETQHTEALVLRPADGSAGFLARTAMLIPLSPLAVPAEMLLFADDRAEERIPSLAIMLHRVTDMMAVRIENLRLLESASELNEELQRSNTALERATQAKTDFLAHMSHEIRTPMNAILGFTQLLSRDTELTAAQHEQLAIINRSGEYLLALLNDVLEMSKIEAGRSVLNPSSFDLRILLSDLQAVFGHRASEKGLLLVVGCAAEVPHSVVADKGKLRQVLVNLLSNAIKFADTGSITVRVEPVLDSEGSPRLVFEVEDTGVGIASEEMADLFAQFEQTSSGRSSGTGTGLGLSISREYARLMGGDLVVRSEPDIGSVFTFDIGIRLDLDVEPDDGDATDANDTATSGAATHQHADGSSRDDTVAAPSESGPVTAGARHEAIPDDLASRLHAAAVRADFETVLAVIDEIAEYDDCLAAELRALADVYDAERILRSLEPPKEREL